MNDQTLRKIDATTEQTQELETEKQAKKGRRPRSMTTLKLQWLAERARKCRRIKEQVEQGTYQADSRAVAKSLFGIYEDDAE